MICITGDTHGDLSRFKSKILRKLRKNDALIICGDFGFLWSGSKKEKRILKKLSKKRYQVLFVEGSHDNYDLLENYPIEEWCGGKTRHLGGRLRQLMRGQVYEIAGKTIFTFGGAQSEPDLDRTEGYNWWKQEQPLQVEMDEAITNLQHVNNKVDFIITHEPPALINEFIEIGITDRTTLNTFLENLRDKVDFEKWFFGKLHINKLIPPKYQAVFDGIILADNTKIKKKK